MTGFGFISTYPPTRCGLATFTEALATAISRPGDPVARVIRVDDLVPTGPPTASPDIAIVGGLRPGSVADRSGASVALESCDVVIVQHEYGIYGGRDGDEILDLLNRVGAPCIVVLHTVLRSPSAHQRWLLERIADLASTLVVMTHAARDLLTTHYAVPAGRIEVIPHGVPRWPGADVDDPAPRPTILTWGLLGPGKGIEWAIRALPLLSDLTPRPLYRVLGQTHPKVLAESGDAYRVSLLDLARDLGVADDVQIDGGYRQPAELASIVAAADVVLLPYDSRDQVTSGVLAEAISAGKPVVATRFPHAVELLSHGAGVLVDHQSPHQVGAALRTILADPGVASEMSRRALASSLETSWPVIGARYRLIADQLLGLRAA